MPSYDYNCVECDENFSFEKSMTDEAIPNCPKCSSENIKRIWGGFQVKGCYPSASKGKGCGPCSKSSCSTCK